MPQPASDTLSATFSVAVAEQAGPGAATEPGAHGSVAGPREVTLPVRIRIEMTPELAAVLAARGFDAG